MIEAKVLLPGISVLARLVAAARDQATERLHVTLAGALTRGQRERLRALLVVAPGETSSGLERKLTATELMDALLRLRDVRDIGVGQIAMDVPAGRERALARYGLVTKAHALRRMNAKRRNATMLAALWQLELRNAGFERYQRLQILHMLRILLLAPKRFCRYTAQFPARREGSR